MGKVLLDAELRSRLNGLNEQLEVCDEAGKTAGYFLPEGLYQQLLTSWATAAFSTPEAEQQRQAALADYRAGRVRTTAEALAHLKNLEAGR